MPIEKFQHSIGAEVKSTFTLGLPLIASQIVFACSGFISTVFLARLGENALAASVLISMIWLTLSVFFFGLLNAVGILVSHQYGAKNYKLTSDIMGQAYLFGILISILIILSLYCVPFFLKFSAQPEPILQLANKYLHALFWMIPGLIALLISEQFLAGIGRGKVVLQLSLLVVPIEIPLIYALIFGKWGFPVCGVKGIGYGFAITYAASAIGLILFLLKSKCYRHYSLFIGMRKVNSKLLYEFIKVGLPLGLMSVIEVSTFAVATFFIARFGTSMLAAHQIVLQYLGFAITLVFAMSQAVSIRVGHAVGRQDSVGIYYAAYSGMILNFMCVLPIMGAFYFFPKFFLWIDINIHDPANAALVHDASSLLFIMGILLVFDNFRIIGSGALRGLKDTKASMYISFLSFWCIGISFAFLFSFIFKWNGVGIWWGLALGILCGAIITLLRLRRLLASMTVESLENLSKIKS